MENTPPALTFLEAILYRDSKALGSFGVTIKEAAAITLDTQIAVATKLLSASNSIVRAQSKRVLAAKVLTPPTKTSETPKGHFQIHARL